MKKIIICVVFLSIVHFCISERNICFADIIIFNENTIGSNIKAVNSLTAKIEHINISSSPSKIELIINDEILYGAVFSYSATSIDYDKLATAIDSYYVKTSKKNVISNKFITWRLDDKKIAISLSEEHDFEKNIYYTLTYRPYN